MSTQLLFYSSAVPLSKQAHADVYVKSGHDYTFARDVNSVPLTLPEFPRAAAEYAIVFAGEGDAIMPAAILGVEAQSNLFVDDEGQWNARYIPAFVRRYPFVFSSTDSGETFTLCIDEQFSGVNREGRGERLFDAEGERTQYLENMLGFSREYQALFQRTREFCARLKEFDLLEPMQAEFTLPGAKRRNLTGFMAVSRERLKGLEDAVVGAMLRSGELEVLYMHLQSMNNFGAIVDRAGGTTAAADLTAAAAQQD